MFKKLSFPKIFSVEFVSHTQYIEDDWEGRNCQDLEMTITQELFLTDMCPLSPVRSKPYPGKVMGQSGRSIRIELDKRLKLNGPQT